MRTLALRVVDVGAEARETSIPVRRLLLAGYTGRDRRAVMAHVRELEQLGVAPPKRVPMVFDVDPALARVTDEIEGSGTETSGEVEVVFVRAGEELLVGVGSDHTDRAHEAIDVNESKGLCAKAIAPLVWHHRDVAGHWDRLELRSWTTDAGSRRLYQEGTLAEFLTGDALLAELVDAGYADLDGTVVFGGTLPTLGGLSCGDRFEIELRDPLLDRSISWAYTVTLPRADAPHE